MKPMLLATGVFCSMAIACASSPVVSTSGGEVIGVTPATSRMLPAGTVLEATLNDAIGTKRNHVGDQFAATVVEPVVAQNGATAVPAGAVVTGHVSGLHAPNALGQQAAIRLTFDNLTINGRAYPFNADIASVDVKNDVNKSGVQKGAVTGAAAGAVLGAIISGADLSKILEGGVLGAAAGTVISLGTGDLEGTIPAGSRLSLRSNQTVAIR